MPSILNRDNIPSSRQSSETLRTKKTVRFKNAPPSSNITIPPDDAQTYMESVQGKLDVHPKEQSSLEKMRDTLYHAFDKSLSTGVKCLEQGTKFLGKKIDNTAKNIMKHKDDIGTSKHIKNMKEQVHHFKDFMALGEEKIMKATENIDEKMDAKISSLRQKTNRFTKKCEKFIDKHERKIKGEPDTFMQNVQKRVKRFKKDPVVKDFVTGMKNLKENMQKDIHNIVRNVKKN